MHHLNFSQINTRNKEVYCQLSEAIYLLDIAKQASEDATALHSIQTTIEQLINLRNRVGSGEL
ncbi:MAG: hypothetical protein F6K48_26790 [Okeania sp. SIO3H1]|uniref:hypothetical protein n=1 Tax=Okeania sp. SIO1I7 TaxID=2607772 RepID=UPI0013CC90B0|nr:hypothetical protein [Okeania sp. SIO1I7]NEN92312.1 hypothetical protein [Okeania sp. SIO3H1]NET24120.1 hypothetical protein [Okeania sp. SIO1I7]